MGAAASTTAHPSPLPDAVECLGDLYKPFAQKVRDCGVEEAALHEMEAEAIRNGQQESMRDIERTTEPGPTSYDNRFFSIGQLHPGSKYARVGTKPAPPSYSFGSLSENALPRVPTDEAGVPCTVEIVGSMVGVAVFTSKSHRYVPILFHFVS